MIASLKPGVKLEELQPQTVLGIVIVASVYQHLGAKTCVITSVNDGKHSDLSKHYDGFAFDVRTKDFQGDRLALQAVIKEALGENYDVVLEAIGQDNEHLHCEYDPK